MRQLAHAAWIGSLLVLTALPGWARADTAIYSIHIGVNDPPTGSDLPTLRYADDDAARMYRFLTRFARTSRLVTLLDDESQVRFPGLASESIPPRVADLELVLTAMAAQMRADREAGRSVQFYFTYSGHGLTKEGRTSLALIGGSWDQKWLEERVLSLPADRIHLFIDACDAEGVVGARGVIQGESDAESRQLTRTEEQALIRDELLRLYPHVGALFAAAAGQESHEWSKWGSGVFTHELLSALAGAADVNADGEIAYSEAAAFISAANRAVADHRARPYVVSLPPLVDRNTPIMSLDWVPDAPLLHGRFERSGHFHLEIPGGMRWLDANPEPGVVMTLLLPVEGPVWVRDGDREAHFFAHPGRTVEFDDLEFAPMAIASRGGIEDSFRRGLFASSFGPAYYAGWIDQRGDVGVSFDPKPQGDRASATVVGSDSAMDEPTPVSEETDSGGRSHLASGLLLTGAGLSLALSGTFTGLTIHAWRDFKSTNLQAPAQEAEDRVIRYRAVAIAIGAVGLGMVVGAVLAWPDVDERTAIGLAAEPGGLTLTLGRQF